MLLVEIEKIYQNNEEIKEYKAAIEESEILRFIETCLWDFNIPQNLEKEEIISKGLETWKKLYGFLDDSSPEEWQQFEEAIRRRPLFKSKNL